MKQTTKSKEDFGLKATIEDRERDVGLKLTSSIHYLKTAIYIQNI